MFLIRICVKLGIIVGLGLLGRIMPPELGLLGRIMPLELGLLGRIMPPELGLLSKMKLLGLKLLVC